MARLFQRNAKTAPSKYPRILFHGIRSAQLLASMIVGGIMCYFMWFLAHDSKYIPWTFIWLTAASLFSIIALAFTMVLHCFTGLHPRTNLALNGFNALLWTLSWSLLTWYMSPTLRNMCDVEHWQEDTGIMVCQIYKTLFTFTLLGFASTIAALALDFYVYRNDVRRGMYQLPDSGMKAQPGSRSERYIEGDEDATPYSHGGLAEPRESEAWETPRPLSNTFDLGSLPPRERINIPDREFDHDTGYNGGAFESQNLVHRY